ncbi:MAG: hypothetical protein JNJ59_21505 [Deltaproteobacteria bacterium]|jgi:hypothetical protein|nr:hypothetical protein [Deltaproteobacteria bacterium]
MARNDGNLRQISVQSGGVTVTLGKTSTTVPADQIDAVIRALEAAKMILGLDAGAEAAPAEAPAAVPAAAPKRRGRPPAVRPVEALPEVVVEEEKPRARRGRPRKTEVVAGPAGRRSRKRVGDALVDWLRDNPGWHSTERLLSVVTSERMTDASPKRALMIALGKQKDGTFASDGHGHWKLAGDPTPAPAPEPKVRKKPGRKPGSGKGKVAATAARAKRQPTGRRRGRPPKSASADKEGSAVPQEEINLTPGRLVRVKRGQDRKTALVTEQELEARRQAATAVDTMHFKWDAASRLERERMRRNLFGDAQPKS